MDNVKLYQNDICWWSQLNPGPALDHEYEWMNIDNYSDDANAERNLSENNMNDSQNFFENDINSYLQISANLINEETSTHFSFRSNDFCFD